MKFTDKLQSMDACSEAVQWVGKRGLKTAWRDCPRGDWMLWLAARADVDHKLIVLAACDCAETALQYIPDDEERPAKAIQTVRNWCAGKASIDDIRAARNAAADYAAAAAAAYAAYAAAYAAATYAAAAAYAAYAAAYAAADAAAYAADAGAAAYVAAATYAAAYDADARKAADKTCADLVRARISVDLIKI